MTPLPPSLRSFLALRADELNQRFARAKRRSPKLDPELVLISCMELLPPLAGPDPAAGELLSSVFELILLHAARDSLALRPGIAALLSKGFVGLVPQLLERPGTLPAALSNAVENLGARGPELVAILLQLGALGLTAAELLEAGAVAAWRLGEARLRQAALDCAARLPAAAVRIALGSDDADWLHSLTRDAWPAGAPGWTEVARVGAFAGFGGDFLKPPLLLDGGDRYNLPCRTAAGDLWVWADRFGAVARPVPTQAFAPAHAPGPPSVAQPSSVRVLGPDLVALTLPRSHVIRIWRRS